MTKNKLSDLRDHLFESIEMLKNNNDPSASENERMDLETAKRVSDISGKIIDSYKVEVQAMAIISKADNTNALNEFLNKTGIVDQPALKE